MEKVKFFCDIILKNIKNSVIIKVGKIGKNIKIKLKMIPLVTFMTWEKLKIMLIT